MHLAELSYWVYRRLFFLVVFITLILTALYSSLLKAKEPRLTIAVSSNFYPAAQVLADKFHDKSGVRAVLIHGSTGKLYSQLRHGLPADLFFSADTHHVKLLSESGIIDPNTVKVYAQGKLILVINKRSETNMYTGIQEYFDSHAKNKKSAPFTVALANPKVAPYGVAAKEVLAKLRLWPCTTVRCVYGEHIAQTYQYFHTGNVNAVFVARSTITTGSKVDYTFIPISQALYTPIFQSAGIIKGSSRVKEAEQFLHFALSEEGQNIIKNLGYDSVSLGK